AETPDSPSDDAGTSDGSPNDAGNPYDLGATFTCTGSSSAESCVVGEGYCYLGGCKKLPDACRAQPTCGCVPEGRYVNCSCSNDRGAVDVSHCDKV
ncbi:MAG TPA: hypothetical protein VIU64_14300, partial [Polyangia bacterium]